MMRACTLQIQCTSTAAAVYACMVIVHLPGKLSAWLSVCVGVNTWATGNNGEEMHSNRQIDHRQSRAIDSGKQKETDKGGR